MARVVVAKHRLPYPPVTGTDVVTYNFLRAAATKHDVVLVSLLADAEQRRYAAAFDDIGVRLRPVLMPNRKNALTRAGYRALFGVMTAVTATPREKWYFNPPAFAEAIKEEAATADLLQFEYWYSAWTARRVPAPRKILLAHDAEFKSNALLAGLENNALRRRAKERAAAMRRRWETEACGVFDRVLCLSGADAESLGRWCRRPPAVVFPIVDFPEEALVCRGADAATLLYVGGTTRGENHHGLMTFVREIYPAIKAMAPGVKFRIRGERPRPELRRAVARDDTITLSGPVADVTDDVVGATVAVVPLWAGAGIKIKILTALAHGLPVVTTPVGAEGIPAAAEDGMETMPDAASFARAVAALLTDRDQWRKRAEGARAFSSRATNPATRDGDVADLYAELARI